MLNKLYIWSRKIHRLVLFAVVALTLLMGTTGLFMKYTEFADSLNIDQGLIRYLHNQLSVYFAIVLGVMMCTGLFMYIFPILARRRAAATKLIQTDKSQGSQ